MIPQPEPDAQVEQLNKFALFLADEFSGAKSGEWRCPKIGAEAALSVVEAIAALRERVEVTRQLAEWPTIIAEAKRYLDGEPLPGTTKPLYDALRKVVAYYETAALRSAHVWQDIATAPKDGTLVLLAIAGFHSVMIAGWCGTCWQPYVPNDWTHWMPLPDPPSQEPR